MAYSKPQQSTEQNSIFERTGGPAIVIGRGQGPERTGKTAIFARPHPPERTNDGAPKEETLCCFLPSACSRPYPALASMDKNKSRPRTAKDHCPRDVPSPCAARETGASRRQWPGSSKVPKVAQIHEDFPRTGTGKARSASYAPNCATFRWGGRRRLAATTP
jgi:hypothetical protein